MSNPYRYQCRGGSESPGLCNGVGGLGTDRAVATQILEAVSPHAVEAALCASEQVEAAALEQRGAVQRELEEARYEASLAARRYDLVDPAKRHVARELEARWNAALERTQHVEQRLAALDVERSARPRIDPAQLMDLAQDLPAVWNAPTTTKATKQRLIRILIEEVVIDVDEETNESVVTIHWVGGRHSETRIARRRVVRRSSDSWPNPVEVMRKLGGHWPDRELAVTMNRMRCRSEDGGTWTMVRARELRERLGIAEFDPATAGPKTISADETAHRLGICISSVHRMIREGILPATQIMKHAPWKVPVDALESEAVRIATVPRSPPKGCGGSRPCTPSRSRSGASRPRSGWPSAKRAPSRWSRTSGRGCAGNAPGSRPSRDWARSWPTSAPEWAVWP